MLQRLETTEGLASGMPQNHCKVNFVPQNLLVLFPTRHCTYYVIQISLHAILLPLLIIISASSCRSTFNNDPTGCEMSHDYMASIPKHCPFEQLKPLLFSLEEL